MGDVVRDTSTSAASAVTATDADGDALTYSVAATAATTDAQAELTAFNRDFALDASTGEISVKSGHGIAFATRSSYEVKYQVSDGENASGVMESVATVDDSLTLTITVLDVADYVISLAPTASVNEGETVNVIMRVSPAPTVDGPTLVVDYACCAYPEATHAASSSETTTVGNRVTFGPSGGIVFTSVGVNVVTLEDSVDEWDEQFAFTLSNPRNTGSGTETVGFAGAAATARQVITIVDDDVPAVSVSSTRLNDEGDDVTVTVMLDIASSRDLTVPFTVSSTTAQSAVGAASCAAGVDYVIPAASDREVTIPAGSTSATFNVETCEDTVIELQEEFSVTVAAPKDPAGNTAGKLSSSGTTTTPGIIDDDVGRVVMAAASVSVAENVSGGEASVTVNLVDGSDGSALNAASDVTVRWSTGSDSDTATVNATGGAASSASRDYTAVSSGSATIAAGSSSVTLKVALNNDSIDEYNEVFTVSLTSATGASVGDTSNMKKTTTVTITDDDAPKASISGGTGELEGDATVLTVSIDIASSRALTVPWGASTESGDAATAGSSCTTGVDYVPVAISSSSVTIPAGSRSATVRVTTCEDTAVEPDETFTAAVGAPKDPDGATAGTADPSDGTAQIAILDDEPRVVTRNSEVFPNEAFPSVSVRFDLVNRNGTAVSAASDVTIGWSTGTTTTTHTRTEDADGGPATDSDRDYTEVTAGTATITAGSSTVTVTVSLNNDRLDEYREVFTVELDSVSSHVHLGAPDNKRKLTEVFIADNDDPVVSFSVGDHELEGDKTLITATIDIESSRDLTVRYFTQDIGSANLGSSCTAGVDYVRILGGSPASATIAAGSRTATLEVTTCEDSVAESDEMFTVQRHSLVTPNNILILQPPGAVVVSVSILDDEPRVVVSGSVSVAEDVSGGVASVSVSLQDRGGSSVNAASAVTVRWSTGSDTDTATVDATGGASTLASRDFTSVSMGSATIAMGSSSAVLEVSLNDDSLDEYDEVFEVDLVSVSNNAHVGDTDGDGKTATVTVVDDDPLPSVSIDDAAYTEGAAGGLDFTVRLGAVSGRDVVVQYETQIPTSVVSGLRPVKTTDFTAISDGEVTISAGSSSADVRVRVANDALDEWDEYVLLYVTSVLEDPDADEDDQVELGTAVASDHADTGTDSTAPRGVITDNDNPPSVSIDDASYTEGATGGLDFTVRLGALSGRDVKVQYRTEIPTSTVSGLRPVKAADFTAVASGEATVTEGSRTVEVTVDVTDDSLDEYREYVLLYVTSVLDDPDAQAADRVVLGTAVASDHADTGTDATGPRGVITDNDDPPTVSVAASSGDEGDDIEFTVSLDAVSGRDVDVNWRTALHTGTPPPAAAAQQADFTAKSGKATITEGATTTTVEVATVEDRVDEFDQTFVVELTSVPGTGDNKLATIHASDGSALGTINDDDDPPETTVAAVTVAENITSGEATLTVRLLHAGDGDPVTSEKTVKVDYLTATAADSDIDAVYPPPDPDPDPAATALARSERKAAAGGDYTAAAATPTAQKVTIAANTASATFTIDITDDSLDEYDELFLVRLATPDNATVHATRGQARIQITDNDPLPSLIVTATAADEADTNPAATFNVKLDAASGRTVTIDYSTGDLTQARLAAETSLSCTDTDSWTCIQARDHLAVAGTDYTAAATGAETTIAPLADGVAPVAVTITITAIDDTLDEHDELFGLTLSPDYANTPTRSTIGTIKDDDDPPTLFIPNSPRARPEHAQNVAISGVGLESEGTAAISGELSTASGRSVGLNVKTRSGASTLGFATWARPGVHFRAVDELWVIPKGATKADYSFSLIDNSRPGSGTQGDYFGAELSGAQYVGLLDKDRMATESLPILVEARDDGDQELLQVQVATVAEDAGTATVYVGFGPEITAARSAVTVQCSTSSVGTSVAGADYTAVTNAEISIMSGAVAAADAKKPLSEQDADSDLTGRVGTVSVAILDDDELEHDERVFINCSTTNVTPASTATGTLFIADDESVPELSLTPLSQTIREADTELTFTARLNRNPISAVTARVVVTAGTATAGRDFTALSRSEATLRFPAFTRTTAFTVSIRDDALLEDDETFTVSLAEPEGATLDDDRDTATVTIVDNDGDPVLSIIGGSASETAAGITFTVTLTPASGEFVSVSYLTADRSATVDDDYSETGGELNFEAGETRKTFTVPLIDDDEAEGNHTFEVQLSTPFNARISLTRGTAVGTIRDDERPAGGGGSGGGFVGGGGVVDVPVEPAEPPPEEATGASTARFTDVSPGNVHAANIAALAAAGITQGCAAQQFCPDQPVTRAEMATFLTRALDLSPGQPGRFADVSPGNVHAANIAALAAAGITQGCAAQQFCPDQPVTRAEMATFLTRALDLPPGQPGRFTDVSPGNVHAANIAALAAAGITQGCAAQRYCPNQPVTRAEMATFLTRALDLPPPQDATAQNPSGS